jgi:MerR family redox-sensitive transcriptional activator SoxR
LTIREAASRPSVPATTLRYYETIGLLPSPPRISGRRHYDPSVLDLLAVITTARRAGFTLAEVRELVDAMMAGGEAGEPWWTMALRKLPEVDLLIQRFEAVSCALVRASRRLGASRGPRRGHFSPSVDISSRRVHSYLVAPSTEVGGMSAGD